MTFNIDEWVDRLSTKSEVFGGLSACPYARTAKTRVVNSIDPTLLMEDWDNAIDVVIGYDSPDSISSDNLTSLAKQFSTDEFVVLEDHPNAPEIVDGVSLNQGEYAILLVQKRAKMEDARSRLINTGYYDNFDKDDLEDLFSR